MPLFSAQEYFIKLGVYHLKLLLARSGGLAAIAAVMAETIAAEDRLAARRLERHFAILAAFIADGRKHLILTEAGFAEIAPVWLAEIRTFILAETIAAENRLVAQRPEGHFAILAALVASSLVH